MNSNITMFSKESDIKVKYGLFDFGEERELARASLKYIFTDMHDIKQSYFKLGFHLNEFKICEYYKDFGYTTFEEFCENNFDLDKSAISRCINVFLMTNASKDVKVVGNYESRGCASSMSEKFQGYSYSQLCEMLPLDDKQRAQVKPDMTIKEIRKMKNRITDISKKQLFAFFDYFRKKVTPFTRGNLLKVFEEEAESWSGYYGDCTYQFRPGKVSINFSDFYSFAKIIKYYEDCGGTFEEVATSQPEEVRLCTNDFLTKKGIVLQNHIKKCSSLGKARIVLYDSNGKYIGGYDCDLLLSGELGGVHKNTYRVIASQEEGDANE